MLRTKTTTNAGPTRIETRSQGQFDLVLPVSAGFALEPEFDRAGLELLERKTRPAGMRAEEVLTFGARKAGDFYLSVKHFRPADREAAMQRRERNSAPHYNYLSRNYLVHVTP